MQHSCIGTEIKRCFVLIKLRIYVTPDWEIKRVLYVQCRNAVAMAKPNRSGLRLSTLCERGPSERSDLYHPWLSRLRRPAPCTLHSTIQHCNTEPDGSVFNKIQLWKWRNRRSECHELRQLYYNTATLAKPEPHGASPNMLFSWNYYSLGPCQKTNIIFRFGEN